MQHDSRSIDAVKKRGGFDTALDSQVLALDSEEQERLGKAFRQAGAEMGTGDAAAAPAGGTAATERNLPVTERGLGLWEKVMFFFQQLFTGISREDFLREREMAGLARYVGSFKPALYHLRTNRVLGAFGEYLYKLSFAMTGLRQQFEASRQGQLESGPGGRGFVEFFIRKIVPGLTDLDGRYTYEYVVNNRSIFDEKHLKAAVEKDIEQLLAGIGFEERATIVALYGNLAAYERLAGYNYYSVLRRFGENAGGSREGFPEFSSAEGNAILFDLTRLEELLYGIDPALDMKDVFNALGEYVRLIGSDSGRADAAGPGEGWSENDGSRLKQAFGVFLADERLTSIIRLIAKNPGRLPSVRRLPVSPVEDFRAILLKRLVPRIQALLHQIDVDELGRRVQGLFGTPDLPEIEFYNEAMNRKLVALELPLFLHCRQVQVAKAFQQLMFEPMVKPALNAIVVDGEFIDRIMHNQLGDFFYKFNEACLPLFEFERKVSLATVEGEKVQSLFSRFSGDIPTRRVVTDKVHFLNNLTARSLRTIAELVIASLPALEAVVKDGSTNRKPELIKNIRQIGGSRNKLVIKAVQRVHEITREFGDILEPYLKIPQG